MVKYHNIHTTHSYIHITTHSNIHTTISLINAHDCYSYSTVFGYIADILTIQTAHTHYTKRFLTTQFFSTFKLFQGYKHKLTNGIHAKAYKHDNQYCRLYPV